MDRGKQGMKRSTAVDAEGIPIGGATDSANRHDSPLLLAPTLDNATELVGALPEEIIVHLDRGYDSELTCQRLVDRGLVAEISQKGKQTFTTWGNEALDRMRGRVRGTTPIKSSYGVRRGEGG